MNKDLWGEKKPNVYLYYQGPAGSTNGQPQELRRDKAYYLSYDGKALRAQEYQNKTELGLLTTGNFSVSCLKETAHVQFIPLHNKSRPISDNLVNGQLYFKMEEPVTLVLSSLPRHNIVFAVSSQSGLKLQDLIRQAEEIKPKCGRKKKKQV